MEIIPKFPVLQKEIGNGDYNRNSGAKSDTSIVKKLKYLIKFQLDIKKCNLRKKCRKILFYGVIIKYQIYF